MKATRRSGTITSYTTRRSLAIRVSIHVSRFISTESEPSVLLAVAASWGKMSQVNSKTWQQPFQEASHTSQENKICHCQTSLLNISTPPPSHRHHAETIMSTHTVSSMDSARLLQCVGALVLSFAGITSFDPNYWVTYTLPLAFAGVALLMIPYSSKFNEIMERMHHYPSSTTKNLRS